jgi:hypothetical protein
MARNKQNPKEDCAVDAEPPIIGRDDLVMAQLIQDGITDAEAAKRTIDEVTARRIAACLHRGLGGELERLAGTGKLRNPQVAREELFYSAGGERRFMKWRTVLLAYINCQAAREPVKESNRRANERANVPKTADGRGAGGIASSPPVPPAAVNLGRPASSAPAAIIYVAVGAGDQVRQPALALHMQHRACRNHVRRQLRKKVGATFADTATSRHQGLRALLSHLAICHHQRVVVQRLDRIPDQATWATIHSLGARVLSVSDRAPRSRDRQAAFLDELRQPNAEPDGSAPKRRTA